VRFKEAEDAVVLLSSLATLHAWTLADSSGQALSSTAAGKLTTPDGLTMSVMLRRAEQELVGGMQDAFAEPKGAMVVQS
jgi:hypothetical protein